MADPIVVQAPEAAPVASPAPVTVVAAGSPPPMAKPAEAAPTPSPATLSAMQHPALAGAPEVEVADRSADQDDTPTLRHHKDFVIPARDYFPDGLDHTANIDATRQFLINEGLRPTGDVTFDGAEKHPDGYSMILHYSGPVIPAVIAGQFDVAHAPVRQDAPSATESVEADAAATAQPGPLGR
jgi:hypothetical protein